jgi:hypothetical protein
MAISFVASGAAVSGAGGLTVAVPAHQAGDLIVILVGAKPNTMTPNTPAGFTLPTDGTGSGGPGTTGVDTGPMKAFVFYNVDEDNSITSVALSSAGGLNVWSAIALVYRSGSGTFDLAAANGVDLTTGTPFEATMGTDPGLAAGDMVAVVGAIPTDVSTPTQFSAETLTATGITTTLDAEVVEFDTQTGNDMGGVVCRFTVNSGASSAPATFSATAGGTTTNVAGPIVLLRIRQAAGGAAHTRTPADGFAFTDARAKAVGKRLADGLALTDARTRIVSFKRTRSDSVAFTDAERETRGKRIADSVALADARRLARTKGIADGLALADARSRTLAYARGRADSLSLTDQATPVKTVSPSAFVRQVVVVL